MFTRAGFNPEHERTGVRALIIRESFKPRQWRPAELIRFSCGDLCWYGKGGLSWGTAADLSIHSWISLPWNVFNAWRAWCSNLTTREEQGEPWKLEKPNSWKQLALALT